MPTFDPHRARSRRLAVAAGVVLPPAAMAWGVLVPRTSATAILLPAALIVSGALIGRLSRPAQRDTMSGSCSDGPSPFRR